MIKRRKISVLLLIAYGIPYVFLGMYGDAMYHSMWLYCLMVVAMLGLSWYCGKSKRILVALLGNLLSLLISCFLTNVFFGEDWGYFFKAFPVTIRTVQFSGIMLVVQAIPWLFAKVTNNKNSI